MAGRSVWPWGKWWRVGSSCACVGGLLLWEQPRCLLCLLACVFPHGLGCVWDWSVCCKGKLAHTAFLGGASLLVVPCLCTLGPGRVGMALHSVLLGCECSLCPVLCGVPGLGWNFPARWGMVFRGKWLWKSQGLGLVSEEELLLVFLTWVTRQVFDTVCVFIVLDFIYLCLRWVFTDAQSYASCGGFSRGAWPQWSWRMGCRADSYPLCHQESPSLQLFICSRLH